MEQFEFALDQGFGLPHEVSQRVVGGRHLFIAPEIPSWVVVDEPDADALGRLSRGATLSDLVAWYRSCGDADDVATARVRRLIQTLLVHRFHSDARPDRQGGYGFLQIHVTNRCNLRCTHCYVASGEAMPNELGLDDWTAVIRHLRPHFPKMRVSVSGGEPLLVPWLDDLLRAARELDCGTAVLTNGLLWTEKRAAELAPLIEFAAVSLDGASAETHDAIRGKGAFNRALAALPVMHRAGIKLVLNVTMMRSNRRDLRHNLEPLLSSLGFPVDIDVANYVVEGRGTASPHETLSVAEFRDSLARLVSPFLAKRVKALPFTRRLNCGYGRSFAMYADGDVSPCLSPVFIRGNIRRDGVAEVFDAIMAESAAAMVDRLPLCRSCDVRYVCGGQCHLHQVKAGSAMAQNDCSPDYRDGLYKGLVARFDAVQSSYRAALGGGEPRADGNGRGHGFDSGPPSQQLPARLPLVPEQRLREGASA